MNNKKSVLFIGAGRANLGAIKAAHSMGLRTLTIGSEGDYPCNEYTDEIINVDLKDKIAVVKALKGKSIDGAVVCCNDWVLPLLGYINDTFQWVGITEQEALICANKYLLKETLISHGVRTANYMKVSSKEELAEFSNKISFPIVIKAVDLQGSKGVYICDDEYALEEKYDEIRRLSKSDYCIIEQFLDGEEIGAQAFVYDNEVLFVMPHGDIVSSFNGIYAPIGHYVPLNCSESLQKDIKDTVIKAIKAIGLNNCAVNVDMIIRNGKPYVLELTGRVGANCLPELTSSYIGMDYYECIVLTAIGENPKAIFKQIVGKPTLSYMLISDKTGLLDSIDCNKAKCDYISIFVEKGSKVHSFRNSNDCIGEVLFTGLSLEDCDSKFKEFMESFIIKID